MSIAAGFLPEFDQEMATTRRLLERVPEDKGTWKPHEKSFSLGHLAQLVARMPGWSTGVMKATVLDLGDFRATATRRPRRCSPSSIATSRRRARGDRRRFRRRLPGGLVAQAP